ncbi:MAG: acyl-CoA dehydrogenase family protein [Acidimicrobiia bacterium]|nr:acyl-CoA dehydrogenase family protein [Acidimicrobiia bacterium]
MTTPDVTAPHPTVEPPPEADFVDEVTRFLESRVPRRRDHERRWGEGDDRIAILEDPSPRKERESLDRAKAWQAELFDAGLGWITGPPGLGGRGLPARYAQLFHAVRAGYETPDVQPLVVGLDILGPAILAHGSQAMKEQYLPRIRRGELVGCQLFSEPEAGSDLAGVRTRAVRDGDDWVLTGQKVWSSVAHLADLGEALVRTEPDAPKHQGLTMFLVDMHAPGVEARPLRQMTGGASFNEVFLDNVRVPDACRIGDAGAGWRVALTSLMSERASLGEEGGLLPADTMWRLGQLVDHLGRRDDPVVRQRLADIHARAEVLRFTNLRVAAKARAGVPPGPEASITKLVMLRNLREISALVTEVLGPRLAADSGEWGTHAWAEFLLGVPSLRIAGGTDEIQRNVLGERALGLPKEPSPARER